MSYTPLVFLLTYTRHSHRERHERETTLLNAISNSFVNYQDYDYDAGEKEDSDLHKLLH